MGSHRWPQRIPNLFLPHKGFDDHCSSLSTVCDLVSGSHGSFCCYSPFLGCVAQFAFERYLDKRGSSCWPLVPIIFEVYALMSFLSLVFPASSIYFNSIREVYEAWVIYNFLSLCLAWVGGHGAVVISLSCRVLKPSMCLMTCCFPPIALDGRFIRKCKQGCLQFVILKPILVVATLILYAKGKYKDGIFSPKQSYLYLTIIYTFSYTMAFYALALFYVACKDLLQPFNPVPKFL